jgi:hypothetical protein
MSLLGRALGSVGVFVEIIRLPKPALELTDAEWHALNKEVLMAKLIGEGEIHPEALEQMRERGKRWAAYQNHAMDSAGIGQIQFIQYGPGCMFEKWPERCPDTQQGLGWRFQHVGFVDLKTGKIVEEEQAE